MTRRHFRLLYARRLTKGASGLIVLLSFASVCLGGSPREDATADTGKAKSEFRIQNSESSDPPGNPVSPDRRGTASNQSASLDDSEALAFGATPVDRVVDYKTDTGEVSGAAAPGKPVLPPGKPVLTPGKPASPVSKNRQVGFTGVNEVRVVDPSNEVAAQGAAPVSRRVPRDVESSVRPAAPTLPDVPWYQTGIGALGIVLAVIGAAVWCVRRWMPTFGGAGCAVLNVVGRAGLSPKHSVALVSLGRRFVLVGLSGDRMTRICEVSDPQEVAELTRRLGQSGSTGKPVLTGGKANAFASLLTGEVNEYAKVPKPAGKGASRAKERRGKASREPLSALLERLRSLQIKQ